MVKKNKFLIISICILILLAIFSVILLLTKRFDLLDQSITLWASTIRTANLTKFMILISEFGSTIFLTVITIVLLVLFNNEKARILLIFNSLGTYFLNQFLKIIFRRIRPLLFMIVNQAGYSYPSGHAMVGTSFYGYLAILSYQNFKKPILKYGLPIILCLLILTIGFSRIYLGVHYFSDVVTGFILGAIIICSEKLLDKR